jgi:hypothetical protein
MPKRKTSSKPKPNTQDDGYPKISILTPLYARSKWLPLMLANIYHFDYDKNKLEWMILDSKDGDEEVKLIPDDFTLENIRKMIYPIKLNYTYIPKKMTIAEKRTWLTKNMSYKYFANMDSDDIYMDQYLKYSIDLIRKNKAGMCGSPQMIFVWPHLDYRITAIECSATRQAHEATFVGSKAHARSMGYYNKSEEKGEGAALVDFNENRVVKSECANQMICVCHNKNSCNKDSFQDINVQEANISGLKIDILKQIMAEEVAGGRKNLSKFTIPKQTNNSGASQ